jgi:hypothetical protein
MAQMHVPNISSYFQLTTVSCQCRGKFMSYTISSDLINLNNLEGLTYAIRTAVV